MCRLVKYKLSRMCRKNTNVSHLIDSMTDQSMLAFSHGNGEYTLTAYMGAAATILCNFEDFMLHVQQHEYNFTHCPSAFPRITPRAHSNNYPQDDAREDQLARIARVFHDDMRLWEKSCTGRAIW
tara:strand:- start:238 stop:612 length:375 start_codon:yes stop_codon:yes gene_type:complete